MKQQDRNSPWKDHSLIMRMQERTRKTETCWLWTGRKIHHGYGQIGYYKKNLLAHRVAWMIIHQNHIPAGKYICHSCDNTSCVNPEHLFIGTQFENIQDRQKKERQARGEKNGSSKLTKKEIIEIRKKREVGIKLETLASEFKVHNGTISRIANFKTWKSLEGE